MPFLTDLVKELKGSNDATFRAAHNASVLAGLGIAGALPTKAMAPGTMMVDTIDLEGSATWSGRFFELRQGPGGNPAARITVGRTAATDIMINDFTVSREQCAFAFEGGQYSISDIGSRNGTLVGAMLLRKPEKAPLVGGEVIKLGRLSFEFLTPDGLLARIKALVAAGG